MCPGRELLISQKYRLFNDYSLEIPIGFDLSTLQQFIDEINSVIISRCEEMNMV